MNKLEKKIVLAEVIRDLLHERTTEIFLKIYTSMSI